MRRTAVPSSPSSNRGSGAYAEFMFFQPFLPVLYSSYSSTVRTSLPCTRYSATRVHRLRPQYVEGGRRLGLIKELNLLSLSLLLLHAGILLHFTLQLAGGVDDREFVLFALTCTNTADESYLHQPITG